MASTKARRPSSITYALTRALKAVQTGPEHAPTVALAKRYAAMLDEDPETLGRFGPPLLRVLIEMRMTPRTRAGVIAGDFLSDPEPGDVVPNEGGASGDSPDADLDPADELRARRRSRMHGAAAVDASTP